MDEVKFGWKEKIILKILKVFVFVQLYFINRDKGRGRKESFDRARWGYR